MTLKQARDILADLDAPKDQRDLAWEVVDAEEAYYAERHTQGGLEY